MGYFDRWICGDCGIELYCDTIYQVWDDVWLSVMDSSEGHLCIFCLEARLGRALELTDFDAWPINAFIAEQLLWMRELGREGVLAETRKRREHLDRRAARHRELKALRRKLAEESLGKEEHHPSS